jgi:hypothetical protein
MAAVTLTTLLARVRERADMPVAGFIADSATGLYAWINEGVQRLHEKLVEAYGEEYISSSASLTCTGSASDVALPSDFFKLYGIDMPVGGTTRTLKPYMRAERNSLRYGSVSWETVPKYSLVGSNIRFLPIPPACTATIYYAPTTTLLASGSDTVNFPNGWERYVVLYAAIQCLAKEESDTRELRMELEKLERDLDAIKENRDAAFPRQVVDLDLADIVPRF